MKPDSISYTSQSLFTYCVPFPSETFRMLQGASRIGALLVRTGWNVEAPEATPKSCWCISYEASPSWLLSDFRKLPLCICPLGKDRGVQIWQVWHAESGVHDHSGLHSFIHISATSFLRHHYSFQIAVNLSRLRAWHLNEIAGKFEREEGSSHVVFHNPFLDEGMSIPSCRPIAWRLYLASTVRDTGPLLIAAGPHIAHPAFHKWGKPKLTAFSIFKVRFLAGSWACSES